MTAALTFGSLFAGIGGLDLGLERAGWKCVWQVENDGYAQKVLAKHWPDVGQWDDVRTFPPAPAEDWRCDLICGGFPCQDISNLGTKSGINGKRSGLWKEYSRVLRVVRPRFVLVENVAALTFRGLDRVLCDLAGLGFDAEWSIISACAVGAPHPRERLFVVGHAHGQQQTPKRQGHQGPHVNGYRGFWEGLKPGVPGVAYGIPSRLDRLRCLGNAVVPQVAEWIGRRLREALE